MFLWLPKACDFGMGAFQDNLGTDNPVVFQCCEYSALESLPLTLATHRPLFQNTDLQVPNTLCLAGVQAAL